MGSGRPRTPGPYGLGSIDLECRGADGRDDRQSTGLGSVASPEPTHHRDAERPGAGRVHTPCTRQCETAADGEQRSVSVYPAPGSRLSVRLAAHVSPAASARQLAGRLSTTLALTARSIWRLGSPVRIGVCHVGVPRCVDFYGAARRRPCRSRAISRLQVRPISSHVLAKLNDRRDP
jgi:hypothetical protein